MGTKLTRIFEQITSLRSPDVEEADHGHMLQPRAGVQLLLLKRAGLILAQVLQTELMGTSIEMVGKFLVDPNVAVYGIPSVITTLEFLQRHFA